MKVPRSMDHLAHYKLASVVVATVCYTSNVGNNVAVVELL